MENMHTDVRMQTVEEIIEIHISRAVWSWFVLSFGL